eukprot:COSAG06_NODE_5281_length_3589_cov_12.089112_4_plen_182_part_00
MIPVDVAACVGDLVTRVISDAAGDYPGVHTREGVIGDRMATAEDIVELQNAELTAAQREAAGAQAAAASAEKRCAEAEAKCAMLAKRLKTMRTGAEDTYAYVMHCDTCGDTCDARDLREFEPCYECEMTFCEPCTEAYLLRQVSEAFGTEHIEHICLRCATNGQTRAYTTTDELLGDPPAP